MSKVYIRVDDSNRIVAIEGGCTEANIVDPSEWILIDEGDEERHYLCQSNYLPKSIVDDRFVYRYKYIDSQIVERSQEEMDADWSEMAPSTTPEQRIKELEAQNAMLTECLLELSEIIYA